MAAIISTKDQERKALARIRKIVESLGPDSYIATAFIGCFDDAEENIENDFALSMNDRWQHAKQQLEEVNQTLTEAEAKAERLKAEVKHLKKENDELALRLPTVDDITDCIALAIDKVSEYEQQISAAATRIVELASEPASPEFRQAVTDHRNTKSALEYFKVVQERLSSIATVGA